MPHVIRLRDGVLVGYVQNALGDDVFPPDEEIEVYEDLDAFRARLAELAPSRPFAGRRRR